jgi:glyoxylase-like metal-dependent hydrolase (beta-lactamase superfamily II)
MPRAADKPLVRSYVTGPLEENVFLLADPETRRAAIIDPGIESEGLLETIQREHWRLDYIINTHGHFDHVFANAFFKGRTGAELLIHEADLPLLERLVEHSMVFGFRPAPSPRPDRFLKEGDVLKLGGLEVGVLHTPGHSPGGVTLRVADRLFVGDALFAGSIGRTDLPGGSHETLIASVRAKILSFPDETVVYPGHGPETTVGRERRTNPFFA